MKGLLLLLLVALAFLSYTAMTAQHTNVSLEGFSWATKICSQAHGLCKDPNELAYGAVGCGVLWLVMLVMK